MIGDTQKRHYEDTERTTKSGDSAALPAGLAALAGLDRLGAQNRRAAAGRHRVDFGMVLESAT